MSYAAIGLHMPKTSANVGSALRAAHAFGASLVATSSTRYKRSGTDTSAAYRHLPMLHGLDDLRSAVPFDCVPVAVDLLPDAVPLPWYEHPKRAFYVFGPEDGTLGEKVTSWCRDRIQIPTAYCLNLAAAVNIVLYDRSVKMGEWR